MDIAEAKWHAELLIEAHLGTEWKLGWSHARRIFGQCHYAVKTIFLSKPLVELNPEDQVLDTILHEIAHALTPGDGHGNEWRAMCRKLGATPKTKGKGAAPVKRWAATCTCGRVYRRDRLPNKVNGVTPNRYCGDPKCPNYGKTPGHIPLVWIRQVG